MTLEIGVLITGIILSLIALVGSMKFGDSSSAILSDKVRVPLGLIGIIMIFYGGYTYGMTNILAQIERPTMGNIKQVDYPVEEIEIISPLDGDSVDCRILTMGVYPEPHEKNIWVLLKPSDEMFYPQSDHTNTSYKRDGEWQVITRFGGDEGENYEIIVYEADSSASQFFSSTIQSWKNALSYPGLDPDEIPAGATEADRIQVSLQSNCRGVF